MTGKVTPPDDLIRSLNLDNIALREQLREALRDNKALRHRLKLILNCSDPHCSVCATCLAAVRDG